MAELTDADGGTVNAQEACSSVGTVMLYFTASWCPPCRRFTPKLAELYSAQKERRVEVILVSRDEDDKDAADYRSHMPWLCLPDDGREGADEICNLCQVRGIPQLLVLEGATGEVLCENGVSRAADFFA